MPVPQVFLGCFGALACMTALSAVMGWAAPALLSKRITHAAAMVLFFVFGTRMVWEGIQGTDQADHAKSELEEAEAELNTTSFWKKNNRKKRVSSATELKQLMYSYMTPAVVEAFSLTFVAEWGDRSQIATIGLAADEDVWGVLLGGIVGHAICTGAAVIGGKHIAARVSERMVSLVGGSLFLLFGVHGLLVK
eukprot:scaffold25_cov342-Pavlova_lutheri.AAC.3